MRRLYRNDLSLSKVWLLVLVCLIFPTEVYAKRGIIWAWGTIGGATGDLDAVSCTDVDGAGRDLATGDMALVFDSTWGFTVYEFDLTTNDAEDDPWIVVPDDRASCSTPNYGQWNMLDAMSTNRTATPTVNLRDSDCTDDDVNASFSANCITTGSGVEECEIFLKAQVDTNGDSALVEVLHFDCDGSDNCDIDLTPSGTGVLKIAGTQIDIGDLGAAGNWTPTGTIDLSSTTDTTYKDATVDPADLASTDFGDFTVAAGTATIDSTFVGTSSITTLGTIATGIWNAGAVTSSGAVSATSGMDLGTSQALVGTTAMTIGDNTQTVAINSSDWDIDATGIATGMGNITSNGTIEGTTLTESSNAVPNSTDHLGFFASTTSAQLYGVLSDETGSATGTPLAVFNQAPTLSGKITRNAVSVDDDDCTGEQGLWWYDDTDNQFEWCNADSGVPTTLGTAGSSITAGDSSLSVVDTGTGYFEMYTDGNSDVSDVGNLRFPNQFRLAWEASPTGTEGYLYMNADENFVFVTASAADELRVDPGNLNISNSAPDTISFDGDDLFVGDDAQIDGELHAKGGITVTTTANPVSSGGAALGTTALEWSNLYLADAGIIYLGTDQDVRITHDTDDGITIGTYGLTNNESLNIDFETTADTVEITSPSGATAIDINTLDLISTGAITGAVEIVSDGDGRTLAASECYGVLHVATGAGTWDASSNCDCETGTIGMNFCVLATAAITPIIEVASDDVITLDGTDLDPGDTVDGNGTDGDFICLICVAADSWYNTANIGPWVDGGAT